MEEVNCVLTFIRDLLSNSSKIVPSDIGVVSPYKLQCKIIERSCKTQGFDNVTVGTSEVFQGQERKVMILSTVVSRAKHPGSFVSSPRVRD